MNRMLLCAMMLVAPTIVAAAECPPLSDYRLMSVSLSDGTMRQALDLLFDGTPWRGEVSGEDTLRLSLQSVSGPLDGVLREMTKQASRGAAGVSMRMDAKRCVVAVSLPEKPALTPARSPAAQASRVTPTLPAIAQVAVSAALTPRANPQPEITPPEQWSATAGQTLREVISGWSERQHWSVTWAADVDYRIAAPLRYEGTLFDAVEQVLAAHGRTRVPLYARGYMRQKMLLITDTP